MCPSCTSASTVPDVLTCNCCWNICGITNQQNAWQLFDRIQSKAPAGEVATYMQNWGNCMKCSVLRQCMSTYEKLVTDGGVQKDLTDIRARCTSDYIEQNLSCPEVCIMAIYEKAAADMPTSPFHALYNNIYSCQSSYSHTEMPQALACFATANSLYHTNPLPNWIPVVSPVANFLGGGSMSMEDIDAETIYEDLCIKPVSGQDLDG